jgi:hypothetical protein
MSAVRTAGRATAKLAATVAIGAALATAVAPAASALNPQPLPPEKAAPATTPLIGGFLTCHEYGCI